MFLLKKDYWQIKKTKEKGFGVFAIRKIKPKEELTISYLLAPRGKNCMLSCPHICKCKSKNCTGTMHLSEEKYQLWQEFQDKESKKTKKIRVVFNKNLPKLSAYPKLIPINPIYSTICPS